MKIDRYTKFILTIIAICLAWICLKDIIKFIPSGVQDVRIVDTTYTSFYMAEPIEVRIAEPIEAYIIE